MWPPNIHSAFKWKRSTVNGKPFIPVITPDLVPHGTTTAIHAHTPPPFWKWVLQLSPGWWGTTHLFCDAKCQNQWFKFCDHASNDLWTELLRKTLEGGLGGRKLKNWKPNLEKKRLQGKDSLKMGMRNTQVAPLLCILFWTFLTSFPSFLPIFFPFFVSSFPLLIFLSSSLLPIFLLFFVSFLPSIHPSFHTSFLPPFLHPFLPSFLASFLPSLLPSFLASFLLASTPETETLETSQNWCRNKSPKRLDCFECWQTMLCKLVQAIRSGGRSNWYLKASHPKNDKTIPANLLRRWSLACNATTSEDFHPCLLAGEVARLPVDWVCSQQCHPTILHKHVPWERAMEVS